MDKQPSPERKDRFEGRDPAKYVPSAIKQHLAKLKAGGR